MTLHSIVAAGALALSTLAASRSVAQVPTQAGQLPGGLPSGMTPDQLAQLLQQNPQLAAQLRQRLQQSRLTADQIRAQLTASGYPANLLDPYLPGGQLGSATGQPSGQLSGVLQTLGLGAPVSADSLYPEAGLIRARGEAVAPESLAGNYVFGVDVFRRAT